MKFRPSKDVFWLAAMGVLLLFGPAVFIPYAHHDQYRYFLEPPGLLGCTADPQYLWLLRLLRPINAWIECSAMLAVDGFGELQILRGLAVLALAAFAGGLAKTLAPLFPGRPFATAALTLACVSLPGGQYVVNMANLPHVLAAGLALAGGRLAMRIGRQPWLTGLALMLLSVMAYPAHIGFALVPAIIELRQKSPRRNVLLLAATIGVLGLAYWTLGRQGLQGASGIYQPIGLPPTLVEFGRRIWSASAGPLWRVGQVWWPTLLVPERGLLGAMVGLGLAVLAVWLVFRITRGNVALWVAAGIFLSMAPAMAGGGMDQTRVVWSVSTVLLTMITFASAPLRSLPWPGWVAVSVWSTSALLYPSALTDRREFQSVLEKIPATVPEVLDIHATILPEHSLTGVRNVGDEFHFSTLHAHVNADAFLAEAFRLKTGQRVSAERTNAEGRNRVLFHGPTVQTGATFDLDIGPF